MRVLGIMGRKNGKSVGRCMCSCNPGGKKGICKNLMLSALSFIFGYFKSEFRKKRYVVISPFTRSGMVQKSKKKKKEKYFFQARFPLRFSYFR